MPFGWAAGAAAVGSIVGGVIQGNAAEDAANTQANAANNATAAQLSMFNTTQQNLAPWMTGGKNALGSLNYLLGLPGGTAVPGVDSGALLKPFSAATFQSSPGYQFQLQQGINAIDNSSSAKGFTGNTMKALMSYGTGLANQDYWNAYNAYNQDQNNLFNRLYQLSGSGQNAAADLGSLGQATGSQIGSNIIGAGNAIAAGQVGSANALSGAISGAGNDALLYGILRSPSMWANQPSDI